MADKGLDKVINTPGKWAMQALGGVANTAENEQGWTGDVSRSVLGFLDRNESDIEKLHKPYEFITARPLSVFFQTIKDVNDPLSLSDTWNRNWERAKYVSPGQAFTGAVASLVPGKQGADKINWADDNQVNGFFKKDNTAAKYISGALDFASSFFLDPLIVGAKATKPLRMAMTGLRSTRVRTPLNIGAKVFNTRVGKLSGELDAAIAGTDNAANVVLEHVVKNVDNVASIEALPMVARSSDPLAVSRALAEAARIGGKTAVADVIKVGIGDADALERIQKSQSMLTEQINKIRGEATSVKEQIGTLEKKIAQIEDRPRMSPQQLKNYEQAQADLAQAKKDLKKISTKRTTAVKQRDLAVQVAGDETSIAGKVGRDLAWSRMKFIEHLRSKGAEINSRGWFAEINPVDDPLFADAVHKGSSLAARGIKVAGYFSPSWRGREVPSGAVVIAGEASTRSGLEFRARLVQAAKEVKYTTAEQKQMYTQYVSLTSDSARFQFLEKFERDTLNKMLQNEFNVTKLDARELEIAHSAINHIIEDMVRGKIDHMKRLINEQNYVHIDEASGNPVVIKELHDHVQNLAEQIANKMGADEVLPGHIAKAKELLTSTPLLRSQVPNVHYGIDFTQISKVLRDDHGFIKGIVDGIRADDTITAKNVKNALEYARLQGNVSKQGFVDNTKRVTMKAFDYHVSRTYEDFQNFVWKPQVLLSLRYTSRNMLENFERIISSISEMTTYYGYASSTLTKGLFDPSIITAPIKSVTKRGLSRIERKGLTGTGGAEKLKTAIDAKRLDNEIEIGRNFGLTFDDKGKKIFEKINQRYVAEGDHFLEKSKDSLAAVAYHTARKFDSFAAYRGTGATKVAANDIAKIGQNIYNTSKATNVSKEFIEAIRAADYKKAFEIGRDSNPETIYSSLAFLQKRTAAAKVQIARKAATVDLTKSPAFASRLERLDEGLDLMLENIESVAIAFSSRAEIMGEWNAVLKSVRVAPERIVPYSEKSVDVGYGLKLSPPMADAMRAEAISASMSTSRAVLNQSRKTFTHLNSGSKKQVITSVDSPVWTGAHSEYVNNILANDDVAKMMIELSTTSRGAMRTNPVVKATIAKMKKNGKTPKEIKTYLASNFTDAEIKKNILIWLKSEKSIAWRNEKRIDLGEYRQVAGNDTQWSDLTDGIMMEVNKFLPTVGPSGEDLTFLRKAFVEDKFDESLSAQIPEGYRSPVYANQETIDDSLKNRYKNLVGNLFHLLATMPENGFARHPFYNAIYRAEGERLARIYAKQGKDVTKYSSQIESAAHSAAHQAVMDRLYTVERHTNLGHKLRWLSPFYMAAQNASRYWVGNALRNQETAIRFVEKYSTPIRLGMVQNSEDNYKVVNDKVATPWSNKGYVMLFDYPQWMTNKFFAGDESYKMEVPLSGFDVEFQGQIPGVPQIGSPIGSVGLGAITRYLAGKENSPFAFTEKQFGFSLDDAIKYVAPYTKGTEDKGILENAANSFLAGGVALEKAKIAIGAMAGSFNDVTTGQQFANRVDVIMKDKLIKLAEDDTEITGAVIAKVREDSIALAINSFWVESAMAGLPLVSTTRFRTETALTLKPELQRSIDENANYDIGVAKFTEKLGKAQGEYIIKLLTDGNTDNRFAFASTEATLQNVQAHSNLISNVDKINGDESLIGVFFNEGDWNADYSPSSANALYNVRINGKPVKYKDEDRATAAEDMQVRAGNREYYAGIQTIEEKARLEGLRKGTNAYEAKYGVWKKAWEQKVADTYPLWKARERTIGQNRVELNLAAAEKIVRDPSYRDTVGKNNPMAMAIKEYLEARTQLQGQLYAASKRSGRTTIDAIDNAYVAELRDQVVKALDGKYPGFQRTFDIYFSGDKLNDYTKYTSGYGY